MAEPTWKRRSCTQRALPGLACAHDFPLPPPLRARTSSAEAQNRFQELAAYEVVINCTGLGAMTLFGDSSMFPIRGHVIRVKASWVKGIYFLDEHTYVIPNEATVVSISPLRPAILYSSLFSCNIHASEDLPLILRNLPGFFTFFDSIYSSCPYQ